MSNATIPPRIIPPPSAQLQTYDIIFSAVGYILIGIAGVVANIFILVVIRVTKSLQSPCFILICLECVCALVYDLGQLVLGVLTVIQLFSPSPPIIPRWVCYLTCKFCMNFGLQGSNLAICLVALDRLVSIISPTRYQAAGGKYIRACWAFCLGYVLLATLVGMFLHSANLNDPVACPAIGPFRFLGPEFMAYFSRFNLTFSVLCVLLYGAMLIAFWVRTRSITDPRAAQLFLKSQRACIPTVKLLMIVYVITAVLHEIFVNVSMLSPMVSMYAPRIGSYTGPLKVSSTLAEITALYFGSTKFRARVKGILGKKQISTAVAPMASGNTTRQTQKMGSIRTVGITGPTIVNG